MRGHMVSSEHGWAMLSRPGINTMVGWIFAFWAGAINTVTTLAILFERASHVSGRLSDLGKEIILDPKDALLVFVIWISFVLGAFLAGKLLVRIGLTQSLLLVAVGIGVGAFLVWRGVYADYYGYFGIDRLIKAAILPTVMGMQNGLTSMLPRVGRSTHWTGDSTDIGLALARGNFPLVVHNTIKIFGFVCGAALMGYMIGMQNSPALHGLVLVTAGFFFTTIFLDSINRALTKL